MLDTKRLPYDPRLVPYLPRQMWMFGMNNRERDELRVRLLEPLVGEIADALFGWLP